MKSLEPADIEADFAHIEYMLDDVEGLSAQVPRWGGLEGFCADIRRLIDDRTEFFSRFDYGWASNPACYPTDFDAWLQLEILSVLSHVPLTHPDLRRHRPTVARLVPTHDFAATTINGELCDYILIAQPYLSLTREFAVLLKRLYEATLTPGGEPRPLTPQWIADAVSDLMAAPESKLSDLFRPMQQHAVALARGKAPREQPPPLDDWIREGIGNGDALAFELGILYQGVDRFLLFHELAHLLHGDEPRSPRSTENELRADRSAMSLALVQLEIQPSGDARNRDALHARIMREVLQGGPAYLQLMRVVTLFGEAHRWTAVMSDVAFGTNQEPLREAAKSIHELEERLVHLIAVARNFGTPESGSFVIAQIVGFEHLVICAKLLLLQQAEVPGRFEDFLPIDLVRFVNRSSGETDTSSIE